MKLVPAKFRATHSDLVYSLVRRKSQPFPLTARPTLIIAPHPDDETLGCAGLIVLKRQQNTPVHVLFLTAGEKGPGVENSPAVMRRNEALLAISQLGLAQTDATFWNYPDAHLNALSPADQTTLSTNLTTLLAQHHIEEIFVTHRADAHPDHEAAFRLTHFATKNSAITLWQYPIWLAWSKPLLMRLRPSFLKAAHLLDISSVLDQKNRALAAYASQIAAFPPGFLHRFQLPHEIFFATNHSGDTP